MRCETRRFIRLSYRRAIRPSRYTLASVCLCDEPKRVGPALRSQRVLASLPVSELSNDLFPQRGRKRLLARDHAGLPDRLANLVDVGIAAGAVGEVALEPLLLVGRQRVVEVVGDDLDHLLAAELGVHGASVVK